MKRSVSSSSRGIRRGRTANKKKKKRRTLPEPVRDIELLDLPVEMRSVIREHLDDWGQPWHRPLLQRVCKQLHAEDPGLILPRMLRPYIRLLPLTNPAFTSFLRDMSRARIYYAPPPTRLLDLQDMDSVYRYHRYIKNHDNGALHIVMEWQLGNGETVLLDAHHDPQARIGLEPNFRVWTPSTKIKKTRQFYSCVRQPYPTSLFWMWFRFPVLSPGATEHYGCSIQKGWSLMEIVDPTMFMTREEEDCYFEAHDADSCSCNEEVSDDDACIY